MFSKFWELVNYGVLITLTNYQFRCINETQLADKREVPKRKPRLRLEMQLQTYGISLTLFVSTAALGLQTAPISPLRNSSI